LSSDLEKEMMRVYAWKKQFFVEIFKNLIRYRFKNNYVGPSK